MASPCDENGVPAPRAGYVSAKGWPWVRGDEHLRIVNALQDDVALLQQEAIRVKHLTAHVKFLRGLLATHNIPLPVDVTQG